MAAREWTWRTRAFRHRCARWESPLESMFSRSRRVRSVLVVLKLSGPTAPSRASGDSVRAPGFFRSRERFFHGSAAHGRSLASRRWNPVHGIVRKLDDRDLFEDQRCLWAMPPGICPVGAAPIQGCVPEALAVAAVSAQILDNAPSGRFLLQVHDEESIPVRRIREDACVDRILAEGRPLAGELSRPRTCPCVLGPTRHAGRAFSSAGSRALPPTERAVRPACPAAAPDTTSPPAG